MKKILISIIIILIVILISQLIYFRNNNKESNTNIINEIVNNNLVNQEEDPKRLVYDEPLIRITEVVEPENIATLSKTYKGNMKLVTLEKELYTFINKNVKEIYNATSGKSINQILQLYDLKKELINNMNIHSAQDFKEIVTEVLKVGGVQGISYSESSIDMESYNNDENGYATFNITFTYTNMSQIKLKVYLANNTNTLPNIKLGK